MASSSSTETPLDEEFVCARQKNGRYFNSFNPEFKMPGFASILTWMIASPNHTNLPNAATLNETLPIAEPQKDIFRESTGLRFIWIGHATCLVQMDDFVFITDPVFSERCGAKPSIGPKRFRAPALTVDQLPDHLQAVLISHNHFDHLDYPSVVALNQRYGKNIVWYCGEGGRQWFLDCGIENVVELSWWATHHHKTKEGVHISFCPAQHWSRRSVFDMNKTLWGGYAVHYKNRKFYFAGDTGYTHSIKIFKQIGQKYGPFDLSAIPIGAYEPRWMMEAQHVSPDEAVDIHIDTKSKQSVGIHWGTWALANEYYLEPKSKLAEAVKQKGLDPKSFITIKHGEIFHVPQNN